MLLVVAHWWLYNSCVIIAEIHLKCLSLATPNKIPISNHMLNVYFTLINSLYNIYCLFAFISLFHMYTPSVWVLKGFTTAVHLIVVFYLLVCHDFYKHISINNTIYFYIYTLLTNVLIIAECIPYKVNIDCWRDISIAV